MKIREHLEKNRGFACVKLNLKAKKEVLLGLSIGCGDQPFYLTREIKTGKIEGPFIFEVKEIIDYKIKGNGTIIDNIPESGVIE